MDRQHRPSIQAFQQNAQVDRDHTGVWQKSEVGGVLAENDAGPVRSDILSGRRKDRLSSTVGRGVTCR